ncbi:defensin-like [Dermacentor variabilis]|uniref:defensin-like n=1 Tax=Dermacentor variabilis TaxID=34621 RepID=UPI003F5B000E
MALVLFFLMAMLVAGSMQDVPQNTHLRLRRGFGCPYNEFACSQQCVSAGKRHGFCGKDDTCECVG